MHAGIPPLAAAPPVNRITPPSRHPLEQTPPGPGTPQSRHPPPREADSGIRSMSGWYASYWNAFLFELGNPLNSYFYVLLTSHFKLAWVSLMIQNLPPIFYSISETILEMDHALIQVVQMLIRQEKKVDRQKKAKKRQQQSIVKSISSKKKLHFYKIFKQQFDIFTNTQSWQ